MTTVEEIAAAQELMAVKLRSFLSQSNVPALGGVLVRDGGSTVIAQQVGIRKLGASGPQNDIQQTDRFNTGSVSKILAAHLIGALIDAGTPGLSWSATLGEVMPELADPPNPYMAVTIDEYTAHVSGMPYTPNTSRESETEYLNTTAADWNPAGSIRLKLTYVKNALLDPSICPAGPGTCVLYSGGQVINAAMLERLTGKSFEELMYAYVLGPLNMNDSGFGRTAWAGDDGTWQHACDSAARALVPQQQFLYEGYDFSPRNPVGGFACSAADLGRFLAESVRPDPQVFTPGTLDSMQTVQVAPSLSSFMRGGWDSAYLGTNAAQLFYVGNDGYQLAAVRLWRGTRVADGALCNANDLLANSAAMDVLDVAETMDADWAALFGAGISPSLECAHPRPALITAGLQGELLTVFARRHTGEIVRHSSSDGGQTWSAPTPFPGWLMTSGLAACGSADGQLMFIFARGTDNQIWFGRSSDGQTWEGSWPVPAGTFAAGPAAGATADGNTVHLVSIGLDQRMYHCSSTDAGQTWGPCLAIGQGLFSSAPAVTVSADGGIVHAYARGLDYRVWWNWNWQDTGWQPDWTPIGDEITTASPAAVASADGLTLHVIGRDQNRLPWHKVRPAPHAWKTPLDGWQPASTPFQSMLTAGAACAIAPGAADLWIASLGQRFQIELNQSVDAGANWVTINSLGQDPEPYL